MNPTTSADALSQLQQIQSQSQDPNTILANQRQQLGVDQAQNTVTGLRGAIDNTTQLLKQVAPSVMGRTSSSLVTNAQAGKQIQNESAPLNSTLTQQGTDYTQADQDLQNLQGQAETAANGIYQGQQDKLSYAQNLYNALYKQEQDAATAAEQKREFDAQQAASEAAARAAASSGGFDLSGGSTGTATNDPFAAVDKQGATNAILALLKSGNSATLAKTIAAIGSSASKGNLYDQFKLQLLKQYKASSPYANLITGATSGPSVARGII